MLRRLSARISAAPPAQRAAAAALAVAAGYFVGANLGFILRFPPQTPSLIWAPNAILTAALLMTPPRRWWIYLLAAFPAHLVALLSAHFPTPLVLALFVTNCSEAMIGAAAVRLFNKEPGSIDTLPRVLAFVAGAVIAGPFLSSFADAAAVAAFRDESYWTVWEARFFSNILSELTVAPAVMTAIAAMRGSGERKSLWRWIEAIGAAATTFAAAMLIFAGGRPSALPPSVRSPFAAILPFLLWCAARFGTLGASLSLLCTSLVSIWAATHGLGPFQNAAPLADYARTFQLLLSEVAVSCLCLAASIEDRRRTRNQLTDRLRFEAFLARLSGAFVHLPGNAIEGAIATWLRNLGDFLHVYRVAVLRFSPDGRHLVASYSWAAPGFDTRYDLAAAIDRLREEKPFVTAPGTVVIPLVASGKVLGGLALDSVASGHAWPEELVHRLQLVAEVFANALARKEAEEALRASELMKSAILASLTSGVAVLDRAGRVIAVNERWASSANAPYAGAPLGSDYVAVCGQVARQTSPHPIDVIAGVEEVLGGGRPTYAFEYSAPLPDGEHWFALTVMPLKRSEGGAVMSHTDVTERRRAQAQAERSRVELAHVSRVSTMGELTGSLAHELSQPLSGIMANAQAATRFLTLSPPRVDELRGALEDIVADDRRATAVIQRLRDLLKKSEPRREPLDLNELIGNVALLLASDAIIRHTTVKLELDPSPMVVAGDRAQLEQVILNLLVNAMDAMAEVADGDRTVVVRTGNDGTGVRVAVEDAGPGVRDGEKEQIFEPFYTTKPTGMGMGLAIARSIVEAHGGSIWVTNNPRRGVTFHFGLPKANLAEA